MEDVMEVFWFLTTVMLAALLLASNHKNRLLEQTLRQAETDLVTGLLFERPAMAQMARQAQRAARSDDAVVMAVFMDARGLRDINYKYGHAAGDRYLRAHAELLCKITRPDDTVFRRGKGSDEFVALLVMSREECRIMREGEGEGEGNRLTNMMRVLQEGTVTIVSGQESHEIEMKPHTGSAVTNITQGSTIEEIQHLVKIATESADPKGK